MLHRQHRGIPIAVRLLVFITGSPDRQGATGNPARGHPLSDLCRIRAALLSRQPAGGLNRVFHSTYDMRPQAENPANLTERSPESPAL